MDRKKHGKSTEVPDRKMGQKTVEIPWEYGTNTWASKQWKFMGGFELQLR